MAVFRASPVKRFSFPFRTDRRNFDGRYRCLGQTATSLHSFSKQLQPGTTVISDCWGAYRDLDGEGYTHRTVNHNIDFLDVRTGAHTNTIDRTWRHVKAFLSPYNRKGEYTHHLAHYMFSARCRAEKVDQFTKFLHLVATIDLSECPTAS